MEEDHSGDNGTVPISDRIAERQNVFATERLAKKIRRRVWDRPTRQLRQLSVNAWCRYSKSVG